VLDRWQAPRRAGTPASAPKGKKSPSKAPVAPAGGVEVEQKGGD
jgi:hypothetical protein